MSRIGRKPIAIPNGVEVTLDNTVITVKGPKGTLTRELHKDMQITVENNEINVVRPSDNKTHRSSRHDPQRCLEYGQRCN